MLDSTRKVAASASQSVARQGSRIWASFALLLIGMWLIKDDPIHMFAYQKLPAALGALGVGSWIMRMTLFKDRADASAWPGIMLSSVILAAVAYVVGAVIG